MLINFRFKNYRSFYDETNLSMQAANDTTNSELNTFFIEENLMPKGENEILKSAVIFGGNASGKSNIIKALTYMVNVIKFSSALIPIVQNNEYFAFKKGANTLPSLYEVEFVENNRYYKYGFEIYDGKISHEWLYKRDERITRIFERLKDNLDIESLKTKEIKMIKVPDNTLFLSIGNNFNLKINEYLKDVLLFFENLIVVFEPNSNSFDKYLVANGKYKKQALEILKKADIGIHDFSIVKENDSIKDIKIDYEIFDDEENIIGIKSSLLLGDMGFASTGTLRLFQILGFILSSLEQGKTIFIDDIDLNISNLMVDYLIHLFNSIKHNSKNAQLICTAENAFIMDQRFRRDQIYFTSKDILGKSSLISLAEYKGVRKNDLYSKRYLAGFYASIPNFLTEE